MSIQPAVVNTGSGGERIAAAVADIQRAISALQAAEGFVPPQSISGGSGGQIKASTVTASEIAAGTIVAANIAAGTITGTLIAANTITAGNIAANTITATQLAANTITAGQIAANTITAGQIAANTITSAQLSSTAIDGMTITGSTFRTSSTAGVSGAGVVIDNTGVSGYDSTPTRKVFIAANTGLITATGVITANSGSNIPTSVVTGFMPGSANRYSNSTLQDGVGAFNTSGWTITNAASAGSTTVQVPYGGVVTRLTASAAGNVTVAPSTITDSYRRVIPGFSYSFSNFVYPATTARNTRIDVAWYNTSGTLLSTTTGTASTPTLNTWNRPTQVAVAPASAAYAVATHFIGVSAATSEIFYVTAFQMEEGDRASAFAPRPDEVLINTISANQIQAGTITSTQLTSTAIDAMTITGALFRSSSSNPKVAFDSTGFYVTDVLGSKIVITDSAGFRVVSGGSAANAISIVDPSTAAIIVSIQGSSGSGSFSVNDSTGVSSTAAALSAASSASVDAGNNIFAGLRNAARTISYNQAIIRGDASSSYWQTRQNGSYGERRLHSSSTSLSFTATTSASSTVTHNIVGLASSVPTGAVAMAAAGLWDITCHVDTFTSTTFRIVGVATASITASVTVYWLAWL